MCYFGYKPYISLNVLKLNILSAVNKGCPYIYCRANERQFFRDN